MANALSAPLALRGFLPAWDLERRRADLEPVLAWVRAQLDARGVPAADLRTLHHHVDAQGAFELAEALTHASVALPFRRVLHRVVAEVLPELPWERVWVQTYAHIRVLVPGASFGPVHAHTDYGFGHGLDERNLWFALTEAEGPGALHVASLRASQAWVAGAGRQRDLSATGLALAPVAVRAGDVLLFTPLHAHGACAPEDATRVSLDLRLRPADARGADFSFSPLVRA